MILFERGTNKEIVKIPTPYDPEKVQFRSIALKNYLIHHGIEIPNTEKENYSGKKFVKVEDNEFPIAFKEIYFKEHFSTKNYYWKN